MFGIEYKNQKLGIFSTYENAFKYLERDEFAFWNFLWILSYETLLYELH